MKSVLPIIIILSFASSAVFGFAFMDHGGSIGHGGCIAEIAAQAKGTPCPASSAPLDFALFHLDIWRNFSMAIFLDNALAFLLVLLVLAVGFAALNFNIRSPAPGALVWSGRLCQSCGQHKIQLNHWLALHENSPAVF